MILLTLSRGKGKETVRLQLPASPAEIGEAFVALDGFFRKRLESYLPMFWKTQEYTNVRPREEKHSCVFLKHYKN